MAYVLWHTSLGFCWWDPVALVVLLGVIVVFVRNHRKLKQEETDLKDELSSLYADETMSESNA